MNATTTDNRITLLSKIMLGTAAVLLLISIFVPLWKIDLDAPQYPEGLALLIYTYKLAGDVEIINGLNHYIGMKTLHAEDFIEFTVLPYIIGAFALFTLITALIGRKKLVYVLLAAFFLFGILAMYDFWRWEYNYGHNLDPNAAIIVPGMAYQPPLIGFKQLLNFGAYSMPSYGGWMFVISGVLMLLATANEAGWLKKLKRHKAAGILVLSALTFFACNTSEPEPIKLNKDNCDYCEMTITDGRFGAELITQKGRIYKFDDLSCMLGYTGEHPETTVAHYFIHDYMQTNILIPANTAFYIRGDGVKSPMGGNVAAFSNETKAMEMSEKLGASAVTWNALLNEDK